MPECCQTGWPIILAGSCFHRPSESGYAAVEGESLAIVWALDQSWYFIQGCDNLLVLTDHKTLVKLFGDKTLDEIAKSLPFPVEADGVFCGDSRLNINLENTPCSRCNVTSSS